MEKITKDMRIGDVIRRHPETRDVFKRLFGGGCGACPGADNEDIYFGSTIHNVDMAEVLKDLNSVVAKVRDKGD